MTESTETSFTAKTSRPPLLRIGVVVAAFLVLVASAALTSAAPSSSSSGTSAAPAASAPPVGDQDPGRLGPAFGFGRGGFGGGDVGHRGFGQITITAITGSNLSLKTADGWSRTIAVTSSTTITKGGQTVSVGDLKVGDQIVFRQTRNSDGTFTIDAIEVVLPHVAGEVTAKSATSITVKLADGTSATIHVGSGTTYRVAGAASASLSDITVGMQVVAQGTRGSDGSLTASTVFGFSANQRGWGPGRMHGWGMGGMPGAPLEPAPSASPSSTSDGA